MSEWRPINGFEGIYEVNDVGQVRSLPRMVNGRDGFPRKRPGCTKKAINIHGYLYYSLSKGGKDKRFAAHRLVAEAFIPNPEKKPEVNHKDGDKHNNSVDNLEWVTRTENHHHAIAHGLWSQYDRTGQRNPMYGKHHKDSTKEKIGAVHRGLKHSEDAKRRMGESHRGKKFSEDHKRKISAAVSASKRGRKWVNDGKGTKCVPQYQLPVFLASGWRLGRI